MEYLYYECFEKVQFSMKRVLKADTQVQTLDKLLD